MVKEMGSEFYKQQKKCTVHQDGEIIVLSGRTALDLIIRDIRKLQEFKTVALPSYCCDSMIEPFIRNNISITFYRVNVNRIEYNEYEADAVLFLDFFGYLDDEVTEIAKKAKSKGQIVIYDSTHYLGEREIDADYIFCSYRKWFFCNFANVKKMNGVWLVSYPKIKQERYISIRNEAANLKEKYINGNSVDKNVFLNMFSKAEELLEIDYVNYSGEKKSFDCVDIIEKRKENAKRLIEGLKGLDEIKLWKTEVNKNDCPLFVPILVPSEIRDTLRKYLIMNKIYCPVHWPITDLHGEYRAIFNNELSLICDQRYSVEEIDREIEVIKNFFEKGD